MQDPRTGQYVITYVRDQPWFGTVATTLPEYEIARICIHRSGVVWSVRYCDLYSLTNVPFVDLAKGIINRYRDDLRSLVSGRVTTCRRNDAVVVALIAAAFFTAAAILFVLR